MAAGEAQLEFDPVSVAIPDVSSDTARILGLPLPPLFRIAIQPRSLQACCLYLLVLYCEAGAVGVLSLSHSMAHQRR